MIDTYRKNTILPLRLGEVLQDLVEEVLIERIKREKRILLEAFTKPSPIAVTLRNKYEDKLEKLFIYETPKYIELNQIRLYPHMQNKGWGTAIMEDLIEYGNKTGKILTLTPSDTFGKSITFLEKFYKKFGFIPNKGSKRDFEIKDTLIRYPDPPSTLEENIRKIKKKYIVYPEKGGKRLGTHPTKKAAQKQLTAIHLNKESVEEETVNIKYFEELKAVLAWKEGERIGALRVEPYLEGYRVESVVVSPEYRGLGIAKEMYREAFSTLGTLYSDQQQSPTAKKVWDSLVNTGEAERTQERYRMVEGDIHEPMNPGILKKRLGKLSCTKVKREKQKLKNKGTTYAKALQRYLNYQKC
jgi:GNAT superfamily N-acetyltransferase